MNSLNNKSSSARINSDIKVGDFLKKKRLEEGLSQEETAQAISISVDELKSYESGEQNVQLNQLYSLANVLNISPSELMELFYSLVYSEENKKAK